GQDATGMIELFAPSLSGNPQAAEFTARMERSAASPSMVQQVFEMFLDIDVRAVLPTIHVQTLVLHRHSDRGANWRAGDELAAHQAAVRQELVRFQGREVKTLGDGYLATFDGPARAIRCGWAIAETARSIGLEVRIGLHSGEVEVMEEDVGGIAVHIAARVG